MSSSVILKGGLSVKVRWAKVEDAAKIARTLCPPLALQLTLFSEVGRQHTLKNILIMRRTWR